MAITVQRDPVDVDPLVQKYGAENMPSSQLEGLGAAAATELFHGVTANELTGHVLDSYSPKEQASLIESRQQTFNALQDIQNRMPDKWYSTFDRGVGSIGGFAVDPVTDAVFAATGGVLGEAGTSLAAKITSNQIAQMGIKAVVRGGGTLAVSSLPNDLSRAKLDASTPIEDDFNYLNAAKNIGSNMLYGSAFDIGGQAIGHFLHYAGDDLQKTEMPNSDLLKKTINDLNLNQGTASVFAPNELRTGMDQAANQIDNDRKIDVELQTRRAFNAQRSLGQDPSVDDVNNNIDILSNHLNDINEQISSTQASLTDNLGEAEKGKIQLQLDNLNSIKSVTNDLLEKNRAAHELINRPPEPISPEEERAYQQRQDDPSNTFFQTRGEQSLEDEMEALPKEDDFNLPKDDEEQLQNFKENGLLDQETLDNIEKTDKFKKALPKFQQIITKIANCIGVSIG